MIIPTDQYLSELVEVYYKTPETIGYDFVNKPIRIHKSEIDAFVQRLAFTEHKAYESRLEHQKNCNENSPYDTYAFAINYLCEVDNITIDMR